jgi:hypothetical protein
VFNCSTTVRRQEYPGRASQLVQARYTECKASVTRTLVDAYSRLGCRMTDHTNRSRATKQAGPKHAVPTLGVLVWFFATACGQWAVRAESDAPSPPNALCQTGEAFVALLDGMQVVDVSDDRYKSGSIGLWTKSDSVTCFDDVEVSGA